MEINENNVTFQWSQASPKEMEVALAKSREAFLEFRKVPAPRRGEILRQIREELSRRVS